MWCVSLAPEALRAAEHKAGGAWVTTVSFSDLTRPLSVSLLGLALQRRAPLCSAHKRSSCPPPGLCPCRSSVSPLPRLPAPLPRRAPGQPLPQPAVSLASASHPQAGRAVHLPRRSQPSAFRSLGRRPVPAAERLCALRKLTWPLRAAVSWSVGEGAVPQAFGAQVPRGPPHRHVLRWGIRRGRLSGKTLGSYPLARQQEPFAFTLRCIWTPLKISFEESHPYHY